MKVLTAATEKLLEGVKSIFLNPYHYTYVIHKEDGFIYLYDEMTMEFVGKTKSAFAETFKVFTFTDNFNCFIAYLEGKHPQQSQILVFALEPDGTINYHRHLLTRNRTPENLSLFSISFLEREREKDKDREKYIVGLSRNRIYYINLQGEIVKDIELRKENKDLVLINGFALKQNKWIFIEENSLYFVTIGCDQYKIDDFLPLQSKIASIFLDASARSQFIAFITELHTVMLMSRVGERWRIRHRFKIPNLNIRKLCFFYPGVNTSTTNRYQDKMYLLIHGDINYIYAERQNFAEIEPMEGQPIDSFPIPNELVDQKSLYIHEYSISELHAGPQPGRRIMPREMLCIKNVGTIRYTIWANEHAENCIRIFNEEKAIISVDLISLFPGLYIGKEWVCLGYKFEPRAQNVLYEETEDNF